MESTVTLERQLKRTSFMKIASHFHGELLLYHYINIMIIASEYLFFMKLMIAVQFTHLAAG